mgnify:CR=1 FL=1
MIEACMAPGNKRLEMMGWEVRVLSDERETIEKVLSGDADSFEDIVRSYSGLVYSICLSMLKDRFESENLAQEVFLKAYRSLKSYRNGSFKSWISRIAINKCIDFKRSKGRRHKETPAPPEMFSEFSADTGLRAEELLILKEELDTVRRICDTLPDIYRQVVTEYFLNSKGISQISEEKGINSKTVETRLYRGLKLCRKKWEEGCT